MNKTILIGIDGATPELINKWIESGKLKNFKKIKENGARGKLRSTIPPFSAPAWTSIVTGCNPGKHGIYGFESTGTLEPHIINSRYRKAAAIWNLLTSIGMKSIIINVPGTYPPEKINGVIITGLLTPSKHSNFTYPSNLKKRLNENDLGEYKIEQLWLDDFSRSRMKKHTPEKLLNSIIKQMKSRSHICLRLMNEIDWDFSMIVLRGTDTVQHFLFDNKDKLLSCYQEVDKIIGNIIDKNPDASFFIVSDHGFDNIEMVFYPDNMLYMNNLLKPFNDPNKKLGSLINLLAYRLINLFLNFLPQNFLRDSKKIKKLLISSSSKSALINFLETKAFSIADGRGIQICRKDKYENGVVEPSDYEQIVDKILQLLIDLKDQKSGKKIIENVYRSKDIYGNDAKNPPDIVFDLDSGITSSEWIRFPNKIRDILKYKKRSLPFLFYNDSAGRSGDHSKYGIFYAYGKGIKSNIEINNISVEDVLPIIFTSLGIPIPNHIDGKIHKNIFINKQSARIVDWSVYSSKKKNLTKIENDKILELKKQLEFIEKKEIDK